MSKVWFVTGSSRGLGRAPEIVHLVESPRLGHALIKLRYRATLRRALCRISSAGSR